MARHATFTWKVFWLPSNDHLLHIIPIQAPGLSFTTFEDILRFLMWKIKCMNLVYFWSFCISCPKDYLISLNTDICWLVVYTVQYLYTIEPAVENIVYSRFQLIYVTLLSLPLYNIPCTALQYYLYVHCKALPQSTVLTLVQYYLCVNCKVLPKRKVLTLVQYYLTSVYTVKYYSSVQY